MQRFARYAGSQWDLEDYEPDFFLNEVLVGLYPDLRGAKWRSFEVDGMMIFEYYKQTGDKG